MGNYFDDVRFRRARENEKERLLNELRQQHSEMVKRILKQLSEAATGMDKYEPKWDEKRNEWRIYCGEELIDKIKMPIWMNVTIEVVNLESGHGSFTARKTAGLFGASGFGTNSDTEADLINAIKSAMASTIWRRI